MNGNPTVISTFAGCGGSSLGYKLAGFKELLAIDFDDNSVKTFKLNFPEVPIWQKDITQIKAKEILDFCNIKPGELDVLDGSPPCQGYSQMGNRKLLDPRNRLFESFIYLIHELQPKVFVMENVSGQIQGIMKGIFKEILSKLKAENYIVKVKLMNAKYYNVPQSRQRLIYIGVRRDLKKEPSFPIPIMNLIKIRQLLPIKLTEEDLAIEKKINWDSIPIKYFKLITPGHTLSYKFPNKFYSWRLLDKNKVCVTINKSVSGNMACPLFIEIEGQLRPLPINLAKKCGSFPEDFNFNIFDNPLLNYKNTINRIGNAVMPNMMKAIALNIKENILYK